MMASLYYIPKLRQKYSLLTEDDKMLINDLNNLSKQVEKLSQLLEIPAEEYNVRRAACTEILEILRKYYPDCLLQMFGSSVNGFGVKNCDLDLLFLPFPGYCNLDFAQLDKDKEKIPIPEPSSILTGETSRDTLSKFDEWSHLKFVRNILRQEKTRVKKVIFMPSMKPPSLKVCLTDSKVVCDLSASNRLVVYNSELLQFFEKLDARVKPLVLCLRDWAHSLGFIKRSFLSSYAFTLLVIFFLQNVSPPILPSVKHLAQLSGFSRTVGGWQTAFTTDEKSIPKSKNTRTLSELMIQFFNFYWNFDFVQYIVCPFTGKPLPVKDLRKSSDSRMASFELSSMSIQDPFIHSHNVCKFKGSKIVFKLSLLTAFQMLNEKSDTFKFSTLFDFAEYRKILDMHYARYMFGRPKVCFVNLDYDCVLSLTKTTKNCDVWFEKAAQAVFDVLEYGLLAECEVTDKISWDKKMNTLCKNNGFAGKNYPPGNKMDDNGHIKSTPYDLELLTSIQCTLYCRTWIGRKNVTEITLDEDEKEDFNTLPLKDEYEISREIIKKNPSFNSPVPLLCFKCDCYKHTAPQIEEMVVMLKPLTFSREFYHVSGFLASYIPKTVRRILASE